MEIVDVNVCKFDNYNMEDELYYESLWEKKCDDPDDPFDFIDYQCMKKNGMLRPILVVNEPIIREAAVWLRDYCHFDVKSRTRKKKKEYIVSLPV